jgi:hypothetical protein
MIVYWSVPKYSDEIFLGLDHPKSAFADFKSVCPATSLSDSWTDFTMCPSVTDFSRNLYAVKSPINLEFWWNGNTVEFENSYSEEFFRKIVVMRDAKGGSLSLRIAPYFFFCEENCDMQYSSPLMASNNFTTNCLVVPGQVNIGKWFRPTDHAFLIKEKNQKIKINKGDTIANVRFLTKEQITFKKFYFTDRCDEFFNKVVSYKQSQNNKLKDYLSTMYRDFENSKLKNLVLNEIKNNLME